MTSGESIEQSEKKARLVIVMIPLENLVMLIPLTNTQKVVSPQMVERVMVVSNQLAKNPGK